MLHVHFLVLPGCADTLQLNTLCLKKKILANDSTAGAVTLIFVSRQPKHRAGKRTGAHGEVKYL